MHRSKWIQGEYTWYKKRRESEFIRHYISSLIFSRGRGKVDNIASDAQGMIKGSWQSAYVDSVDRTGKKVNKVS